MSGGVSRKSVAMGNHTSMQTT
jgi:uncharacterized protein with PIN domain